MTVIIDYGVGNLFSLSCSLKSLGIDSVISGEKRDILSADRIILPGVGAFGDAIKALRSSGLIPAIYQRVSAGAPLLGICLGMQLLFEKSYEFGEHEGLGLIPGAVVPMKPDLLKLGLDYKVPQIGWNSLIFEKPGCPLLKHISAGDFVYYVHSYYAKNCENSLAAWSDYGVKAAGVVWRDNIFGTQFHPEKSGRVGLSILKAFCEL